MIVESVPKETKHCADLLNVPDVPMMIVHDDGEKEQLVRRTLLHSVCIGGDVGIAKHLVSVATAAGNREFVSVADSIGQTAFHVVCGNGHAACARALGSSCIRTAGILYGCTPFLAACKSGCVELVVWLYEMGVSIETPGVITFKLGSSSPASNFTVAVRMSPLACAVTFEHKEVVRLLLKWGAKHTALAACIKVASDGRDEARAFDQKTPLQIAEWTGDDDIKQLLVDDLTTRQPRGTPTKERASKAGVTLPPTPSDI